MQNDPAPDRHADAGAALWRVPGRVAGSRLRRRSVPGAMPTGRCSRRTIRSTSSRRRRSPSRATPTICPDRALLGRIRVSSGVTIAPRGGGTGTNGQSLTDGLVVDVSRHMNRILEINAEERWARVQAGVVKDQLNAAVARTRPVLRAGTVDVQPRDHRRHDRHRRERSGLLPVRQDARPRPRADDRPAGRHAVALVPAGGGGARRDAAPDRPGRRRAPRWSMPSSATTPS